jgi:hypothetical protein
VSIPPSWGGVNPRDGAPAVEHAYAATIYQAQGATLDSAFVMADPSMTRQEFYVATSRSRGETFLYATPEAQLAREEIAPRSPYLGGGLRHIAEAAERDGSQAAAHDEVLRSRLGELSPGELSARLDELRSEVGAEWDNHQVHRRHSERVRENAERLQQLRAEREALPEPPRWERRADRAERWLGRREEAALSQAERLRAEARELPEVAASARAEATVIEALLADRERLAVAAARLSPPPYIKAELGERPSDPAKQAAWDRGVREIEGYRQRNSVVDRDSALGPKPRDRAMQQEQRLTIQRLQRLQRDLGRKRVRSKERSIGLGIGR